MVSRETHRVSGGGFGARLKQAYKERGHTQKSLADALETHQTAVSDWATGKVEPQLSTIARIADVLGCSVDFLVMGRGTPYGTEEDARLRLAAIIEIATAPSPPVPPEDVAALDAVLRAGEAAEGLIREQDQERNARGGGDAA